MTWNKIFILELLLFITLLMSNISIYVQSYKIIQSLNKNKIRLSNKLFSSNNYYNKNTMGNQRQPYNQYNNNDAPKSNYQSDMNNMNDQIPRSDVPSRSDTLKVLISGMIGSDPRENYLTNGHYVINFSLAVVGHYTAVHEWERYKPTETTWINAEIWDDLAKDNLTKIRKGTSINGIGYFVLNKWMDKVTGEEKKIFKLRISKLISPQVLSELTETFDDSNNKSSTIGQSTDSNFSSEASEIEDQSSNMFSSNNDMYSSNNNVPVKKRVWNKPVAKTTPPSNYNNNYQNEMETKYPTWDSVETEIDSDNNDDNYQ